MLRGRRQLSRKEVRNMKKEKRFVSIYKLNKNR